MNADTDNEQNSHQTGKPLLTDWQLWLGAGFTVLGATLFLLAAVISPDRDSINAVVWIGVNQLLYVIPMAAIAALFRRPRVILGIVAAAGCFLLATAWYLSLYCFFSELTSGIYSC